MLRFLHSISPIRLQIQKILHSVLVVDTASLVDGTQISLTLRNGKC